MGSGIKTAQSLLGRLCLPWLLVMGVQQQILAGFPEALEVELAYLKPFSESRACLSLLSFNENL